MGPFDAKHNCERLPIIFVLECTGGTLSIMDITLLLVCRLVFLFSTFDCIVMQALDRKRCKRSTCKSGMVLPPAWETPGQLGMV